MRTLNKYNHIPENGETFVGEHEDGRMFVCTAYTDGRACRECPFCLEQVKRTYVYVTLIKCGVMFRCGGNMRIREVEEDIE